MILSIIIPIYNVEQYIGRCLNSIYRQGIDDSLFEVVAINDGTQDNSMEVVHKFASIHSNLVVINKENGGVSSARNLGVLSCSGEYVSFLDADDYIEDSLNKVIDCLSDYSSDVCVLRSFNSNTKKEHNPWKEVFETNKTYTGIDIFKNGYLRHGVCGCIYQKKFLLENAIVFPQGIKNGEDTFFVALTTMYANKVLFEDISFYVVFNREGSASTTYSFDRILNSEKLLKNNRDYYTEHDDKLSEDQKAILDVRLYESISSLVKLSIDIPDCSLWKLKKIVNIKKYLPIRTPSFYEHINYVRLLNFSFGLFYFSQWLRKQL